MSNILFFDTETTGLPRQGHVPRIVQLAALLCDAEGKELDAVNMLIKPEGENYSMTLGAYLTHKIEFGKALSEGVPLLNAMHRLNGMIQEADTVVAHNLNFDYTAYKEEVKIAGLEDCISGKRQRCTMHMSTPIVKLPATERMVAAGMGNRFKSCNLQEAHQHFMGAAFENAHDALADVKACSAVYFAMTRAA